MVMITVMKKRIAMKTKINISNDERTGVETMNVEQLERELKYKIAKYEQLQKEAYEREQSNKLDSQSLV